MHNAFKHSAEWGAEGLLFITLLRYFRVIGWILIKIETFYEGTAWVRDLIHWAKKSVGMKHKKRKAKRGKRK